MPMLLLKLVTAWGQLWDLWLLAPASHNCTHYEPYKIGDMVNAGNEAEYGADSVYNADAYVQAAADD